MRRKEESYSVYLMKIIYKSHKIHRLGTMDPTSSNRPKQVSDGNRNENQQITYSTCFDFNKNPTNNNEWHINWPEEPLPDFWLYGLCLKIQPSDLTILISWSSFWNLATIGNDLTVDHLIGYWKFNSSRSSI